MKGDSPRFLETGTVPNNYLALSSVRMAVAP
jgi:hypothetical protein